jgi:hypothetical protein
MPLKNFLWVPPTQVRQHMPFQENQMTREISLRKKPGNRGMNPPRKSRGIHDLLLPMATIEMHSATNHMNKAGFRSLMRGYTTGKYATGISLMPQFV